MTRIKSTRPTRWEQTQHTCSFILLQRKVQKLQAPSGSTCYKSLNLQVLLRTSTCADTVRQMACFRLGHAVVPGHTSRHSFNADWSTDGRSWSLRFRRATVHSFHLGSTRGRVTGTLCHRFSPSAHLTGYKCVLKNSQYTSELLKYMIPENTFPLT